MLTAAVKTTTPSTFRSSCCCRALITTATKKTTNNHYYPPLQPFLLPRTLKAKPARKKPQASYSNHVRSSGWSVQQLADLKRLHAVHGNRWSFIATELGETRSKSSIRARVTKLLRTERPSKTNKIWSIEEVAEVQRLRGIHGDRWQIIAERMGGERKGKEIQAKIKYELEKETKIIERNQRRAVKRAKVIETSGFDEARISEMKKLPRRFGPWSAEEVAEVQRLRTIHGNKWELISMLTGDRRSGEQIMSKMNRWSQEAVAELITLHKMHGDEWTRISKMMKFTRKPAAISAKIEDLRRKAAKKEEMASMRAKVMALTVTKVKTRRWTSKQTAEIERLHAIHGDRWHHISTLLGSGRDAENIHAKISRLKRAAARATSPRPRMVWSPEAITELERLYHLHGNDWKRIASLMHGTVSYMQVQCKIRDLRSRKLKLDARIALTETTWSPEENGILRDFIDRYSFDWETFHKAGLLTGRNEVSVRLRMIAVMAEEHPAVHDRWEKISGTAAKDHYRKSVFFFA